MLPPPLLAISALPDAPSFKLGHFGALGWQKPQKPQTFVPLM